ncbi:putative N-acetylglucosamine-6-phosphate deacetylase [Hypsibius exemplaris]|uniref:N-acetylglucosamine-6-phosphate deacetylase n=1 Tax=Hypsibius exemplaris TaxID=2072580 RepID=A0A1W0WZA5_HYPEX|nr:putative N-acetylglucosamine-6-phosphate deacetylase [Hypsibius exemplaris]
MDCKRNAVIRLWDCRILRDGALQREDLWMRNGKIIDPEKLFFDERRSADVEMHCPFIISPGFIDIQINGGFGVDFTSCTATTIGSAVALVRKNILAHGVTSFCPTVITSSPALYHELLPHVKRARGGAHGAEILGLHLEGPYINKDKKGAHRLEFVQTTLPNGAVDFDTTYGDLGDTSIITVAPELEGGMVAIEQLAKRGITVSLGHSDANIDLAQEAIRRGARCMTHLFNAMPQFHHRDPGMVGLIAQSSAANLQTVFYGLIADGVHTHPATLKIAYRAHPKGAILVTDAISAMGFGAGIQFIAGVQIEITGNHALIAGTNTLCGSIATMDRCIRYFLEATDCSIVEALESASLHPAQLLGISDRKGTLNFYSDADFVVLDDHLHVLATFIAGECVWQGEKTNFVPPKC